MSKPAVWSWVGEGTEREKKEQGGFGGFHSIEGQGFRKLEPGPKMDVSDGFEVLRGDPRSWKTVDVGSNPSKARTPGTPAFMGASLLLYVPYDWETRDEYVNAIY